MIRALALVAAIASAPLLLAEDPEPTPAPAATATATYKWDTPLAIPTGTPCPGETNQRIVYPPHISISAESRATYARDNADAILIALIFTYLDGSSVVLIHRDAKIEASLRAAVHAYGKSVGMQPVLEGCSHLAGGAAVLIRVSTGDVRMEPITTDLDKYS